MPNKLLNDLRLRMYGRKLGNIVKILEFIELLLVLSPPAKIKILPALAKTSLKNEIEFFHSVLFHMKTLSQIFCELLQFR